MVASTAMKRMKAKMKWSRLAFRGQLKEMSGNRRSVILMVSRQSKRSSQRKRNTKR